MKVRMDIGTYTILTVSVACAMYLWIVPKVTEAIFPLVIAVTGLVFMSISGTTSVSDEALGEKYSELNERNLFYIILALGTFLLTGLVVRWLPLEVYKLSTLDRKVYATLMAVSEEAFFRGFITSFLYRMLYNPYLSSIFSGLIFSIYHLGVYQQLDAIIYTFMAGVILAYIFIQSKSLFPGTVAHIVNNLMG
ncbi:MAG: CPBP family intramembrane glutamic endopeptidase [Candidatus Nanoarchaeia archaeon]|nr:CPBP family intramembrane metalloprotease [Candidatus Jingweiarchaeum tengchongense]